MAFNKDKKENSELVIGSEDAINSKTASSDSLVSDSKSSSLNSKLGQESVSISRTISHNILWLFSLQNSFILGKLRERHTI